MQHKQPPTFISCYTFKFFYLNIIYIRNVMLVFQWIWTHTEKYTNENITNNHPFIIIIFFLLFGNNNGKKGKEKKKIIQRREKIPSITHIHIYILLCNHFFVVTAAAAVVGCFVTIMYYKVNSIVQIDDIFFW